MAQLYGARHECQPQVPVVRPFTLPFLSPFHAGFSSAPKSTRMLAFQGSLIVLISLQPLAFNVIL